MAFAFCHQSKSMLYLLIALCLRGLSAKIKPVKDLQIIVEHKPEYCNEFAAIGDVVHVDYTGMLEDGRTFDSSMKDGRGPFRVQLGSGTLIKGWERGLHGMCVGERRKLVIPPSLAYGAKGVEPVIPPDATLIFTVHLVNLERRSIWNRIESVAHFTIYPAGALAILYYLYRKANQPEEDEVRKPERRYGKKKK